MSSYSRGTRNRATNRKDKKKARPKPQYPTNNLLPISKSPHLDYLKNDLGEEYVNSFEIVQQVENKDGISMLDLQNLYNVK